MAAAVVFVFPLVRFKPSDKGLLPYGAEETTSGAKDEAYVFGPTEKEAMKAFVFPLTLIVVAFLTLCGTFQSLLPTFADNIGVLPIVQGFLLSCFQIGNTAGMFLLPTFVDKLKIAKTTSIGCISGIVGAGLLIATALFFNSSVILLTGGVLLGIAASAMALIPMIVRSNYGTKDYGKLFSYHQIVQIVVGCLGITAYSLIIEGFGLVASQGVIVVSLAIAFICIFTAEAGSKKKFNLSM
jgi:MFS family permease